MKFKKFFYRKVNSTNDLALKKIRSGFTKGIIVSEHQNKGRGQFGKKWISFKGNLFMSVFFVIKKNISSKKMTTLNCEIIKKTLFKYFKANISIKYPNDLLINKKKFCGILQETTFNKGIKFMIVGIGLNLIKNPKIKNYPTTNILIETGIQIEKLKLIKSIENNYSSKLKLFA
jgi:BirA family biotin operon repressor/biotin-[acetyl-CoA-carboxylase] ligase